MTSFADRLQRRWWQPRLTLPTALLAPLGWLVAQEAMRRRRAAARKAHAGPRLPVPVVVIGNLIVGGAGKTPTAIALIQAMRQWGWTPGIVSRGHGRATATPQLLDATTSTPDAAVHGDEPLLMHRRTNAPIAVARDRRQAARDLLAAHPEVDVIVADDGLQHHRMPRDIEVVVFDGRGLGNGRTLPAGPLREPVDALWPQHPVPGGPERFVLVNGHWPAPPALALPVPPDHCWIAERALGGAVALADWRAGAPATAATLHALRGRTVLAAAGIGEPERFFTMLEARGLRIERLPLPDHAAFDPLPWPAATQEVVVTEKDAVKLPRRLPAGLRVWVVTLDFRLPAGLADALRASLDRAAAATLAPAPNPPSAWNEP